MKRNSVRIIAGTHKRRLIHFPQGEQGLRPTADRVKETLFNWLQMDIHGARCCDAFAGSGALGFEALSRGAESCTFIDMNTKLIRQINDNAKELGFTNHKTVMGDALSHLRHCASQYDIIFVDPPFHQGLAEQALNAILSADIDDSTLIYVEVERKHDLLSLEHFHILKQQNCGIVCGFLIQKAS